MELHALEREGPVTDPHDDAVGGLGRYDEVLGQRPAVDHERVVPGGVERVGQPPEDTPGVVVRAPELMHGKTSFVSHGGAGVLAGLPNPFEATRYHSLVVERATVPDCLEITAETDDGVIMGLRHKELPVEGVQFHPESILTAGGHQLLENFLSRARVG